MVNVQQPDHDKMLSNYQPFLSRIVWRGSLTTCCLGISANNILQWQIKCYVKHTHPHKPTVLTTWECQVDIGPDVYDCFVSVCHSFCTCQKKWHLYSVGYLTLMLHFLCSWGDQSPKRSRK